VNEKIRYKEHQL